MTIQSTRTHTTWTALASAIAVMLALSSVVNAQRGEPVYYEPPTFDELDIDNSGTLEPAEVQGRSPLAGQWERFDTNGDGAIDREEFTAFQAYEGPTPEEIPPMPPAADRGPGSPPLGPEIDPPGFDELDINGDGVLSKGEAGGRKGLLDAWWQVDQNQDNVIDRDEFAAFEGRGPSLEPQEMRGE